jgi:hypothetical protein
MGPFGSGNINAQGGLPASGAGHTRAGKGLLTPMSLLAFGERRPQNAAASSASPCICVRRGVGFRSSRGDEQAAMLSVESIRCVASSAGRRIKHSFARCIEHGQGHNQGPIVPALPARRRHVGATRAAESLGPLDDREMRQRCMGVMRAEGSTGPLADEGMRRRHMGVMRGAGSPGAPGAAAAGTPGRVLAGLWEAIQAGLAEAGAQGPRAGASLDVTGVTYQPPGE